MIQPIQFWDSPLAFWGCYSLKEAICPSNLLLWTSLFLFFQVVTAQLWMNFMMKLRWRQDASKYVPKCRPEKLGDDLNARLKLQCLMLPHMYTYLCTYSYCFFREGEKNPAMSFPLTYYIQQTVWVRTDFSAFFMCFSFVVVRDEALWESWQAIFAGENTAS